MNRIIFIFLLAVSVNAQNVKGYLTSEQNPSSEKVQGDTLSYSLFLAGGYFSSNLYSFGLTNLKMYPALSPMLPLMASNQFIQMKENIAFGFKVMNKAREKRNLGTFGKILGYTNAVAAFGLAAYHISKYGWNGAKKREKK